MQLLVSPFVEPHFNLALEEYLFENYNDDFIVIYRNKDSVVVGKHQNAMAEANLPFLTKHNIPLHRRFSGGGTVFHDINNVNFSFITTGESSMVVDFKKYAQPVIDFLRSLGIPAELSERNDILVEGKKVSGHAAHAKNKRALHHGTLLFNSDLKKLSEGLKTTAIQYESNAVQSVRSKVANLKPYLKNDFNTEVFVKMLVGYLSMVNNIEYKYELKEEEKANIESLALEKYSSWDWNYGYSPPYSFACNVDFESTMSRFVVNVKKGHIEQISIDESHTFGADLRKLEGIRHHYNDVEAKLSELLTPDLKVEVLSKMF